MTRYQITGFDEYRWYEFRGEVYFCNRDGSNSCLSLYDLGEFHVDIGSGHLHPEKEGSCD